MIDVRVESIIYQSQIYYRDLVNALTSKKKLGKALDLDWDKADRILGMLEALNYRDRLTDEDDINDVNFILYCLIDTCELNQYPIPVPLTFQAAPAVILGVKGDPGDTVVGPQGETGLATDFQVSLVSVPTVVDTFDITDAKAARWDYYIMESSGEQRAGTIIGHWLPNGSQLELTDISTDDIGVDSTDALVFDLEYLSGNIRLIATPSTGVWTIVGSRYFIPNNGTGSGPISGVLTDGKIYIGNTSNLAQERTVSGVISITNTGVTSFTAGAILNADINSSAGITLSKLAELPTHNRVLLSSNTGVITESGVSNVTLGYLDATSSIQTQLNARLIDPMTTIGDIIIRNGSNITARLGVGSNTQVLTVSGGLPTWAAAPGGISGLTTGYLPKASSASSLTNSIISESTGAILIAGTTEIQGGFRTASAGVYYKVVTADIGDWNMDSTGGVTVTVSGVDCTKIVSMQGVIRSDPNYLGSGLTQIFPIAGYISTDSSTANIDLGFGPSYPSGSDTVVTIRRRDTSDFDNAQFNATGYNRGTITVTYTT